jgi:site-specific DNA-methyltransferase (adenine-specific)
MKKKQDMENKVIQGDCLEELKNLEDNSVDAVVTDPPYGLSFMGKKWDYDVPSTEIWKECLRVLKPGGYLLSFAGTRTQHRMAVRIEDAGFEIRDMIAWVYGSGFPKSLNIGKAVDKLQGNEREFVGTRQVPDQRGGGISSERTIETGGVKTRETTDTKGTSEWEGWGTALKPALEPITVARKPLSEKTVAENVLKWGTGGINIDGSRVGTTGARNNGNSKGTEGSNSIGVYGKAIKQDYNMGRFPANLIHDGSDEVVELFPNSKSSNAVRKNNGKLDDKTYGKYNAVDSFGFDDSGSSARFFYCAKASKSERNRGCEELEEKDKAGKDFRPNHAEKAELGEDGNPFGRWGKIKNNHPTVKPIALMEYLVKLVSKENAVVLDPFAGSGSTLLACKNLNRNYIGIEREADYIEIINKRLQ